MRTPPINQSIYHAIAASYQVESPELDMLYALDVQSGSCPRDGDIEHMQDLDERH